MEKFPSTNTDQAKLTVEDGSIDELISSIQNSQDTEKIKAAFDEIGNVMQLVQNVKDLVKKYNSDINNPKIGLNFQEDAKNKLEKVKTCLSALKETAISGNSDNFEYYLSSLKKMIATP